MTAPGDSLAPLVDALAEIRRRLDVLERPTGTSAAGLVQQVQTQLSEIDTRVQTAIASSSYTKNDIDSKDAALGTRIDGKANSSHGHAQSDVSGTWTKDVDQGGMVRTGLLYATGAAGYNITGTRVAGWWETATGRAGTASSSERFKSNIRPADIDPAAVFDIGVSYFEYTDEVRKRDDPTFDGYVGPHHHVATNIGVIAERLHELGLWQLVVYERDHVLEYEIERGDSGAEHLIATTVERLRLDDNGEPIPFAVHDTLIGYVVLIAARHLHEQQQQQNARLDALTARLHELDQLDEPTNP